MKKFGTPICGVFGSAKLNVGFRSEGTPPAPFSLAGLARVVALALVAALPTTECFAVAVALADTFCALWLETAGVFWTVVVTFVVVVPVVAGPLLPLLPLLPLRPTE